MTRFIHRLFNLNGIMSRFFFWTMLLIILTSSLYLIIYIAIDKKNRIDEANKNLKNNLVNQQIILENWASDRAEDIRLLASFPISKELELDTMATRFQYYHQYYDQLNSIVFVNKDGFVNIDTAADKVVSHDSKVNLKKRAYFIAAEQGQEYIYDVVVSSRSSEPVIIFSSPVFIDDKEFLGVTFGAVYLSRVNEMLQKTLHGKTGEITLVNKDGIIISHLAKADNKHTELDVLTTELDDTIFKKLEKETTGFLEYTNHHGNEVFGSFVSLYDGRYFLINEISKKEVLQSHYQMIIIMSIIAGTIIVLALIIFIPVSKRLLKPFFYLLEAIKTMTAGDYNTKLEEGKFETSPVELQQMMYGFNKMATSINNNKKLLQHISNTDGLTGIANRRLFDYQLEEEWQYARNFQKPISLVFFDVDFFKKYNDNFGHQKGDQCLIKIANVVSRMMENTNHLVARYGGEEFIIILQDTNSKEALKVAENVQKQVKMLQIPRKLNSSIEIVTVSIGVATMLPSKSMMKSSLIQLADQALYEAKSLGRDRVVVKHIG